MKKHLLLTFLTLFACLDLSASSFSKVDSLYFDLQTALDNSQDSAQIISDIIDEQNKAIGDADLALCAILQAQPLILAGKGESLALQALGYNSLYLFDNDRKTLGDGVVNYFTQLKVGYHTQNALINIGPQAALGFWFNNLRSSLINAGLQAPTEPAGPEYNYDVITLIDYNVDLLRDLDSDNFFDLIAIQALMGVNQQSHQTAVSFTGQGIELVDNFSTIVQALNIERDTVSDPTVIDAILASLPDSDTANTFLAVQNVYQLLADYVDQHGLSDKDGYIDLYDQLRPLLILASQ